MRTRRRSGDGNLLDWLNAPATDADRIRLARLLASGRRDAVAAALQRLADHHAAGDALLGWQRAAADLLAVADRPTLRTLCLREAARLHGAHFDRPVSWDPHARARARPGIRRYGPPPRLQGCKGKAVRWRHVPAGA